MRLFLVLAIIQVHAWSADSLPILSKSPQNVDQLWAGYDPRKEPLEVEVVRQWKEDGLILRYVCYQIGTFKGKSARMAGFYGFPEGKRDLPALMHLHGGGQRAFLHEVKRFAKRGYATLSINWGGREMEMAQSGDPNTEWGAVDPTQNNVSGYSNLVPGDKTIDPFPSPRNNNWFLLAIGGRRGLTFLEHQPEVDSKRIGVYGHSMGGRLTGLVAGSDERVSTASPSVGGSGFLQSDLWGLPDSARRVRGDLGLFQRTIAGQVFLARIRCPILYLSSTNDFNAPMDFVEKGMSLISHNNKRTVYAPHLNHRFTPSTEISRPLWFDAHLQQRLEFPSSPTAELSLNKASGITVFTVKPDRSRPIDRVDLYYGYGRDPRNRFYADAKGNEKDGVWFADCPIYDLDEPLFAYANVYYKLTNEEKRLGDPSTFVLSVARSMYPAQLKKAGVQPTEMRYRLIDDFSRGLQDWYALNKKNRHHWLFATRKLVDPRWEAPLNGKLSLSVETTSPGNTVLIQVRVDSWRGYTKRKATTWSALSNLSQAGQQTIDLSVSDFRDENGQVLKSWFGITELIIQPGNKAKVKSSANISNWKGSVLKLKRLSWKGGEFVQTPKAYLPL